MNYEVMAQWGNGFYVRTRRFKLEQSAFARFLLECDMLTQHVTLEQWQQVNGQRVRVLLATKDGYRHESLTGKMGTLLNICGDYVKVSMA